MGSVQVNTLENPELNGKHVAVQLAPTPPPVGRPRARRRPIKKWFIAVCIMVLVLAVSGVVAYAYPWPYEATINGKQYEVKRFMTVDQAIASANLKTEAGNFLAIDGKILEAGKGEPYTAFVNGEEVDPAEYKLRFGDSIEVSIGADIVEDSSVEEIPIAPTVTVSGSGAIHEFAGDKQTGVLKRKTGLTSGTVIDEQTTDPGSILENHYNIDTGGDKVIALTFDDGPWPETTSQVLDLLEANDAKATFFMIGTQVEDHADQVKRSNEMGNQLCTHSWDHAQGSGQRVNLGLMTPDEIVAEITDGQQVIVDVVGGDTERVIRAPGGNLPENVTQVIYPYADYEIGWNIDTMDWSRPGVQHIIDQLMSAQPGDIILMHDGGGDRSQTIEALAACLPELKDQGYKFVTIDELLEYAK